MGILIDYKTGINANTDTVNFIDWYVSQSLLANTMIRPQYIVVFFQENYKTAWKVGSPRNSKRRDDLRKKTTELFTRINSNALISNSSNYLLIGSTPITWKALTGVIGNQSYDYFER